jgi:cell division septum initiation protein DivIVA
MSPEPPVDATGIARRHFPTVRKGYEPDEVRAYLHELSDLVGRLQRGEAHERERAERAETRAQLAEQLDQHRLVELLGEETARVLEAAREAGSDIRAKGEESASRMIREAQSEARSLLEAAERDSAYRRSQILAEADALRREAEAEVERRRAEGQGIVDIMRREAEAELETMLADGERARAEAEATAEQIRASAREQGRRLVGEAQTVRERMLGDLARRRRTAREQLERLNGARERLLAAYEVVKRTVDDATTELTVALPEARLASEVAMRRVSDEPEETVEVLEAELSVARMTGLIDEKSSDAVSDEDFDEMLRELAEEQAAEQARAAANPAPFDDEEVEDNGVDDGDTADLVVVEVDFTPASGAAPSEGDDDDEAGPDVDELFARIRAERPERAGDDDPAEAADAEPTGAVALAIVTEADGAVGAAPAGDGGSEPAAGDEADAAAEDDDPEAALFRERDAALGSIERELGRRLKRVLADEQNEVLDTLRRGRSVTFDDVLPAGDEHIDRFAIAAMADLDAAADQGAASVGGAGADSCDELAGQLGRTLVEPLRTRIERSFDDCNGDLEEVSERLRALYREWKGQQIGVAVRHYTAAAYAQGAYGATADGEELRWIVDRSAEACPDADDNALAGPVGKGEPFPTGDRCSPAHPGCRCLVVPAKLVTDGH